MNSDFTQLAPGVTITCRDEQWLVTGVARSKDGYRVRARGISEYVRDTTATFFTALDTITVFNPAEVAVVADTSSKFRHSKLWLESTLRRTPIPVEQEKPEIATQMLLDPLDYQLAAVEQALSNEHARPRVLLADAVGLGKTLEIGMILAELIRRGQGDRILVVTPKHVMEQFQQELWTRFAIPLIRLDSLGIQRVRQKLPASKNPFTYFSRVIVSMDTLKSPKYRAQLQKVKWNAVVIDEIHNATNAGSQNNELARTLAPTTESLILASATPHNGRDESFKEVLRLLDPLSIFPDGTIDVEAAKKLIIRRHRNSPEVARVVGEKWAERKEPNNILVVASAEENAVAEEISRTWLEGSSSGEEGGSARKQDRLFPWTLVKAFLSSPRALDESINSRRESIKKRKGNPANWNVELENLATLQQLNDKVTAQNSNKFATLVNYLQEIGIGKKSPTRVAIFSERVATLRWLKKNLEDALNLPKGAVKVMHGGLPDVEQLALIDEFKRTDTPLRVLITGDVASEGVNLHAQCHHLVHYDIPWSLIRIQQRNGRIDRYGQRQRPEITSLLLDPKDKNSIGELHVLTRLVEREFEANKYLGDVAPLMGKYNTKAEEDEIREVLANQRDFESTVRSAEEIVLAARSANEKGSSESNGSSGKGVTNLLFNILQGKNRDGVNPAATHATAAAGNELSRRSIYTDEISYLRDALSEAFLNQEHAPFSRGGVEFKDFDNGIVALCPPNDLQRRFDFLPQDYVKYRKIKDRLQLAITKNMGNRSLEEAREGDSAKSWPAAHYLGPLHPVTEWAADRALVAMGQQEIPAIEGSVNFPTVLVMTTITNKQGRVLTRAFTAVQKIPGIRDLDSMPFLQVPDVFEWLKTNGLDSNSINRGSLEIPKDIRSVVSAAVNTASVNIGNIVETQNNIAQKRLEKWQARHNAWEDKGSLQSPLFRSKNKTQIQKEQELLTSLVPDRSLVRPLLVVLPQEA